jgi:hypothetical protein
MILGVSTPIFFINKKKVLLIHMSGISKFKRIYSEGVASEHPDVAGQKEFANKADEILARRKRNREQSGKNAKLDAIGRKLYNMNKIGEETELGEAHWDPATKTIGDKKRTGTDPEIQAMAAKAAASGPKKRKPLGSVRKNSADFKPSSPEQAKSDKKSWDNYWEGSWKKKKMNEKIDVGADAGSTISDFVHSKSKTFKGDSKNQRIKRALGAYYAAQKEETESIYDYVIEALVDSDFAQDYETAENMFECMSDEFVAVILEEYIEEKARGTRPKKTVHAYDVDETLFGHGKKGKPNVQVHVNDASGKRIQSLSNQDFNTHKLDKDKGHSYDFSEFQSAKKFKETSSANKKVIKDLKRRQARGQNVHIITARSKFDKPSEFQGHLQKHGVDVPMNKIHYTGGMKGGDIGQKKVDVANAVAKKSGAKTISMYDDAAKVHKAFEKEKQNKPTSVKIKTRMVAPDKSGEANVRSYQGTKGGRTSDNPTSTIRQTQRRRQRARRGMGEEVSSYDYWKQFINDDAYQIQELFGFGETPKPKPSNKVLAYKNYQSGVLDKGTGKFTQRAYTDAEQQRYGWKPIKASSYSKADTPGPKTASGQKFDDNQRLVAVPYKYKKGQVPKGVWKGTPSTPFDTKLDLTTKPMGAATKIAKTSVQDTGNFGAAGDTNKEVKMDLSLRTAKDLAPVSTANEFGKRMVYAKVSPLLVNKNNK